MIYWNEMNLRKWRKVLHHILFYQEQLWKSQRLKSLGNPHGCFHWTVYQVSVVNSGASLGQLSGVWCERYSSEPWYWYVVLTHDAGRDQETGFCAAQRSSVQIQ